MTRDRYVLVSAGALDDALDLVDRALPTILDNILADALRGAVSELRCHSLLEPA